MGAAVITPISFEVDGNKLIRRGTAHLSTSYATNGDAFTLPQLGLSILDDFRVDPQSGYMFDVDYVNNKIRCFVSAGTEQTATTDMSATVFRWAAVGV